MRKSKKKLLAMLLAGAMVFGTLPSDAFANNEQDQTSVIVEETVTTDDSANTENENAVEAVTEDETPATEETTEAKTQAEAVSLEKTEEVIAGEKYVIVYDNKEALSVGKDQVIAVPVEVEGDTVKTEITKNMVWTVDDNNNLVSELGKKLSSELTLQEDNGQSFKFNAKNVYYENGEVNTYLIYNEESNKWSFNQEENDSITYYNVIGPLETLEELTQEKLDKIEEDSNETTEPTEESVEDKILNETTDEPQDTVKTPVEGTEPVENRAEDEVVAGGDLPSTFVVGKVTYVLDTNGIDNGAEYLIINTSNNKALKQNDTSVTAVDVTVNGSLATINDNYVNSSLWTFTSAGSNYYISNRNYYFGMDDTDTKMLSNGTKNRALMAITKSEDVSTTGEYTIKRNDITRYLTYSNSNFIYNSSSTNTVKLYKKVVEEDALDSVHFPVTMYNYNKDNLNTASVNASGEGTPFLFGPYRSEGTNAQIAINGNLDGYVTQGILSSTIVGGQVSYSNGIKGIDLFGTDEIKNSNGNYIKEVYNNVEFPFAYDSKTGYYEFNSESYHTHIDTSNKTGQTLNLYSGSQLVGRRGTFFPFNSEGGTDPTYYFGMNLSVNFMMTTDGKLNEENIKFEFSGDDDVWVYVDNQLVLDLGGIHDAQGGTIDFATRTVTYNGGRRDITNNKTHTSASTVNFKDIFTVEQLAKLYSDDGEEHTLQVLYLERGANVSNCKIKFNLPQKDRLEITKKLGATTPIIKDQIFIFNVKYSENGADFIAYSNKKYKIYENGSPSNVERFTDESGTVTLKANQTAIFVQPQNGSYKVEEMIPTSYESPTWISQLIGNNNSVQTSTGVESPTIVIENGTEKFRRYQFVCTNYADVLLNPDTVVIDYGKPIAINITANDNKDYITGYKVVGLSNPVDKSYDDFDSEFNLNLTNGNLTRINDNEILYTPTSYMDSIELAIYKVEYDVVSENEENSKAYVESDIKIIPATSVYYEDNFAHSSLKEHTGGIEYDDNWVQVTTDNNGKIISTNSFEVVSGQQDNGTVLVDDHPYGNDSSYLNNSTFSNGTAMKLSGKTEFSQEDKDASFTFTGTGFDLISLTNNDTGSIIVKITNNNGLEVKKIVNNQYKSGALYQIPVINFDGTQYEKGGYATYTVKISVGKGTDFYLDAIRVYNPLGFNNAEANQQYQDDDEYGANIREVRNLLISNGVKDGEINGIVYVDGSGDKGVSSVTTYTSIGPNNEVYLKNGNTIAFRINGVNEASSVQLGIKSADGSTGSVQVLSAAPSSTDATIKNITLETATDMYYDITEVAKTNDGVIYITNTGESVISVTNLKVTCNDGKKDFAVTVDDSIIVVANMLAYEASSNKSADIDGNGTVDILDLANVANNQGKEVIIGVSTDIYKQDLTASRDINRDDLNIVRDSIE